METGISAVAAGVKGTEPVAIGSRLELMVDDALTEHLCGGEIVTSPILFEGLRLLLNFATSAAGSSRVEVQDAAGTPIEGYRLSECGETFGDSIERAVTWQGSPDVAGLAGAPPLRAERRRPLRVPVPVIAVVKTRVRTGRGHLSRTR